MNDFRFRGLTAKSVQEINRGVILRMIYERRLCSRSEIAQGSGLDASTVTRVVQQLVDDRIVEECILQKVENVYGWGLRPRSWSGPTSGSCVIRKP